MDILQLVDRLEELFNQSKPIWLTHSVIVDEDKFLDIIDQMRITVPEEVKKAKQLYAQKDRILAQAQEEANRTVEQARLKATELVEKEVLVEDAQRRATEIIDQSQRTAEEVRQGADQYSEDTLAGLITEMERILNQARNGMLVLEKKRRSIQTGKKE
jgi:chemotaxis protein histidine kinase CheA